MMVFKDQFKDFGRFIWNTKMYCILPKMIIITFMLMTMPTGCRVTILKYESG